MLVLNKCTDMSQDVSADTLSKFDWLEMLELLELRSFTHILCPLNGLSADT